MDNSIISKISPETKLGIENQHQVTAFLKDSINLNELKVRDYGMHETIVTEGRLDLYDSNFSYAQVPLGLIVAGNVTVFKNNRHTKRLGPGDFIGLFETADFLTSDKNRHIGNWTLTTEEPSQIIFFPRDILLQSNPSAQTFCNYLLSLAKNNSVPQPISSLPLLDWFTSYVGGERLLDYAIIAHTHILPNNAPLFRHLAHLVSPQNLYVVGKAYSTTKPALDQLMQAGVNLIPVHLKPGVAYDFSVKSSLELMWYKVLEDRKRKSFSKLLILDDGGDIWTSLPWDKLAGLQIAGVEQTRRGITRITGSQLLLPPIVSVATAGIKTCIESVFIARSVARQVVKKIPPDNNSVGIIGMGNIGQEIYHTLSNPQNNFHVSYYDPHGSDYGSGKTNSLDVLMQENDVIIGATGTDALQGIPFERISGHKILVSASSADVEFASIRHFAATQNFQNKSPFEDLNVQLHNNLTITLMNGGYPINFDRISDATPDNAIVLTRCLLYLGMMQAKEILESRNESETTNLNSDTTIYNLDPTSQKHLLNKWFADYPEISKQFSLETEFQNISDSLISDFKNTRSMWDLKH